MLQRRSTAAAEQFGTQHVYFAGKPLATTEDRELDFHTHTLTNDIAQSRVLASSIFGDVKEVCEARLLKRKSGERT